MGIHQNRIKTLLNSAGVKELTKKTGISAPQLYRYAKGAPIPSDKLAKLTACTGYSADWILHGTHSSSTALKRQTKLYERVLSTLQYKYTGKAFNPITLSKALQLFWINDQFMKEQGHLEMLSDEEILMSFYYISSHEQNGTLDLYLETAMLFLENPSMELKEEWANPFCDAVINTAITYYDSPVIKSYFSRLDGALNVNNKDYMNRLISQASKYVTNRPIKLLDIGCGCGRHLSFLYRNYPDLFHLTGTDSSRQAAKLYQANIEKGGLPKDSFLFNKVEDLAHSSDTYDMIYNQCLLHYIPAVENSTSLGLGKYLSIFSKLLNKGGAAKVIIRVNYPNQFLPIYTFNHKEHIESLAAKSGLVVQNKNDHDIVQNHMPGTQVGRGFSNSLELTFLKLNNN